MSFELHTERLILRSLQLTDVHDFYRMDSHPEVHRFLGNDPVKSLSQAEAAIAGIIQQYKDNGIGRWAVIEKQSGRFIGWSGLKYIKEPENNKINFYDVGYRFHPEFWGKGYATESGTAAIRYGFEIMLLDEIAGTCHVENIASRKALEKCGLRFIEKFIYKNEMTCDWLAITKQEWMERVAKSD